MQLTYIVSFRNYLLLTLLIFSSCKKFVEVPPPDYELSSNLVFASDATATSAVVSMYAQMITSNIGSTGAIGGNISMVYGGLYSDELIDVGDIYPDVAGNVLAPNSFMPGQLWTDLYKLLYQANNCIAKLPAASTLTPALRDQLLGEAEFIRAYCYFYLTNFFGKVPLVTSTDYTMNATLPRASQAAVYEQIIKDLIDARTLLKETYPSNERVRVNKWAATALLARVYLYNKDWVNAEAMATAVIGSGTYTPLPALNNVFLKTSTETIWQLMPVVPNQNTYEGTYLFPATASSIPFYALNSNLAASFDTDPRKTAWTGTNSTGYSYAAKYKVRSSSPVAEYCVQLRLAEQYLIRAEALARQNKTVDAATDINVVRNRAGATPIALNLSQPALLLALEQERRWELFTEMGHRFLDLKRTGRADAVLAPQKPGWTAADTLFPIPLDQLKANPFLTQNDAYLK